MPKAVETILFKAARKAHIPVVVVANRYRTFSEPLFSFVLVPPGPDKADDTIVAMVQQGDVVITADIPLAARVTERGATVITPRGSLYTADTIGARLTVRDYAQYLRDAGVHTDGASPFGNKHKQAFAATLDTFLFSRNS